MSDTFKATLDGGILVCKPGSLPSVAAQMRTPLQQGRRVYVRMKHSDGICVTLTGFPPEAVAHNQVGDERPLPEWVQSIINFMTN